MSGVEYETPGRVLAVYAHPDDPEISAGGTLARWADAGRRSARRSSRPAATRARRDPDADPDALVARARAGRPRPRARVLGLASRITSTTPTASSPTTARCAASSCALVRTVRPDVVLCPDPTAVFFGDGYFNHRDHRVTGWATLDAIAPAAGNPHYFPELRAEGLDVHRSACGLPLGHARAERVGRHRRRRSSARSRRCSATRASSSRPATGSASSCATRPRPRAAPRASRTRRRFRRIAVSLTGGRPSGPARGVGRGPGGPATRTGRAASSTATTPAPIAAITVPTSAPPSSLQVARRRVRRGSRALPRGGCSATVGVLGHDVFDQPVADRAAEHARRRRSPRTCSAAATPRAGQVGVRSGASTGTRHDTGIVPARPSARLHRRWRCTNGPWPAG